MGNLNRVYTIAEGETKGGTQFRLTCQPVGCAIWLIVLFVLLKACGTI